MAAERSPAAYAARAALFENGREFMTLTRPRVDTRTVGGLFAPPSRARSVCTPA